MHFRFVWPAVLPLVPLLAACGSSGSGISGESSSKGSSSIEAPAGAEGEFETDFPEHGVPYEEISSGGVPKDGIPPIDEPSFVGVEDADGWLEPEEPVILVESGGEARAYPLQVIMWHETVTFCPLCNTAIAFEGELDGRELDFGTTVRLRFSNLIMYDHQTESWWQQATGKAIAGELTGSELETTPALIVSWEDFQSSPTVWHL